MKYNAKKTIALILSVVFVLMLFAGCGSSSNGGNESKPANRLEEIKQRGYITVTMEPYFAPNEFIHSSKTGDDQYVGSDIEFASSVLNCSSYLWNSALFSPVSLKANTILRSPLSVTLLKELKVWSCQKATTSPMTTSDTDL